MLNGWLTVMGPGGTPGLADRQLSQILACSYANYSDWLCPHCHRYIHSSEFKPATTEHYQPAGRPAAWVHSTCSGSAQPISMPVVSDHALTTVLYAYHAYCCDRPETADDLRKLLMAGKRVIIIAHDLGINLPGLAAHVHGVLCHSAEMEAEISQTQPRTTIAQRLRIGVVPRHLPLLPPGGKHLVTTTAKHVVGWHGLWRPDRNVHALVSAILKLRAHGLDVGLIAQGALVRPGIRIAPSSQAYFNHCARQAANDQAIAVDSTTASWADLATTLAQCSLFCLPTICSATTKSRSSAALTCLAFQKPTILTDCALYRDALNGAIPLFDQSIDGIATRLLETINGTIVPPDRATVKISAIHQPYSINNRYLSLIRSWIGY